MNRLPLETRDCLGERLAFLYGAAAAPEVLERIEGLVRAHTPRLPPGPRWDAGDVVLITYGDTLQRPGEAPLITLADFVDTHLADAVSIVHILPFSPYSSDDGFSITDFRAVNPDLGTWDDIRAVARHCDLMIDLVLNHASRESLWFADYLNDKSPGRDYFIDVDPATNLSMVVRPRSTPLLTRVRTYRGIRHLWATFSNDQIDLNYRNPEVLLEFVDILLAYIRAGARIIRLDAIAYLWKEIGTPCVHLPQTHAVVKLLRDLVEAVEPRCLLLTETNVPNAENLSYFGDGDEAHMVYQFSLPPLLLHALHTGSTRYLTDWARGLAPPPPGCTYLNFTASHDGVGLRPLEGLVPVDEVKTLLEAMRERGGYISTKHNMDGSESPYELNISYFDAFRDPRPHVDRWHVAMFLLSQTVALALRGIPAIYIHSLLATPNDLQGVERTGQTRSINRRKWDRTELEALIGREDREAHQVFHELLRRIRVRRLQAAFDPDGDQRVLDLGADLFGVVRSAPEGGQRIVCLHNFTPFERRLEPSTHGLGGIDGEVGYDVLTGRSPRCAEDALLLPPYGALWLTDGVADCSA